MFEIALKFISSKKDEVMKWSSHWLNVIIVVRITIRSHLYANEICFSILRTYGSHSEQWISMRRGGAMRRRRSRASPAIKTLRVSSILLNHDFKSHIPSAYLNENPDCVAFPKHEEARCVRGSRNVCYTNRQNNTTYGKCDLTNSRKRRNRAKLFWNQSWKSENRIVKLGALRIFRKTFTNTRRRVVRISHGFFFTRIREGSFNETPFVFLRSLRTEKGLLKLVSESRMIRSDCNFAHPSSRRPWHTDRQLGIGFCIQVKREPAWQWRSLREKRDRPRANASESIIRAIVVFVILLRPSTGNLRRIKRTRKKKRLARKIIRFYLASRI